MAMQFEYDDKGTTFYYFVLSFLAMVLLPCTYYFWPDSKKKDLSQSIDRPCYCSPCISKNTILNKKEPRRKAMKHLTRAGLVVFWALLVAGVAKVAQFEKEYNEYNPYDVLGLEQESTMSEIKKAYRQKSMILHPDRGGDPVEFMKVSKAYKALTDKEAKANWDNYGNPDGPTATQFGIALPSWIVDKENSMWVLGAYILAIIVILPIVVGTWWYRSIQYSADEVLMDTEQMYLYFFHRTPNMSIKRVIMILAASLEFEKSHNNKVQERPTDNIELPKLIRDLSDLKENNKEVPLCYPYSVKARTLLHAHLTRLDIPTETLMKDLHLILKKCPYLIKEMMSVVSQLIMHGKQGRVAKPPNLATVEHLIKLSQMLVQGVWECSSPLLMLPHITQDNLRHFNTKKRRIKTIRQFVGLKNEERRLLLRTLEDEQYEDVINVCWSFPYIEVNVDTRVIDIDKEDQHIITSNSVVTAVLSSKRTPLGLFFEDETTSELPKEEPKDEDLEIDTVSKPIWQRKQKKGKGGKKTVKKQPKKKKKEDKVEETIDEDDDIESKKIKKKLKSNDGEENEEDSEYEINGVEDIGDNEGDLSGSSDEEEVPELEELEEDATKEDRDEDDDEECPTLNNKDLIQLLEGNAKDSHICHSPFLPLPKQEHWWCYVVEKRTNSLVTAPTLVTSLKEEEQIELKFTAPEKTGTYHYTAWMRSDVYLDFDVYVNFKIDVSEAKEFDATAHWEYSSDDEGKDDSGESVYETEDEEEEEN